MSGLTDTEREAIRDANRAAPWPAGVYATVEKIKADAYAAGVAAAEQRTHHDASWRSAGCLPFCNGGLHDSECPNLRAGGGR